ncbi:MAG: pentapeptide repeat-containing protein [Leptolyngbyaceae cyanobacterium bins.59]|nr:pentapeptide repeat-containing protein [Leptolyngbyaceae cyanobacterium bins.59]
MTFNPDPSRPNSRLEIENPPDGNIAPPNGAIVPPISAETRPSSGENSNSPVTHSATLAVSPLDPQAPSSRRYIPPQDKPLFLATSPVLITLVSVGVTVVGLINGSAWLQIAGATVALLASLRLVWPLLRSALVEIISDDDQAAVIGSIGLVVALLGFMQVSGLNRRIVDWANLTFNWDAVGALGEVFGALGQIFIAILAVYIAWRQYVISKDLTIQQNTITQQQTIDTYFQGVSDLVLDEEGLLEDWPQERSIAEGRTAAILSSVNAEGKAKIIRFLSRAKLLTPLRRDRRLGRAILDGAGGYEEDRVQGIRVIDLGVMLAGADLAGTDLRWTDLSEANLIRADLSGCDLVKANLSRTILYEARFRGADLTATRFFYGKATEASPRNRTDPPNYKTGAFTGAVVENADFTAVQDMTEDQRYYVCAWGGSKTRSTVPGGCQGIPNLLGR